MAYKHSRPPVPAESLLPPFLAPLLHKAWHYQPEVSPLQLPILRTA